MSAAPTNSSAASSCGSSCTAACAAAAAGATVTAAEADADFALSAASNVKPVSNVTATKFLNALIMLCGADAWVGIPAARLIEAAWAAVLLNAAKIASALMSKTAGSYTCPLSKTWATFNLYENGLIPSFCKRAASLVPTFSPADIICLSALISIWVLTILVGICKFWKNPVCFGLSSVGPALVYILLS